MCSTWMNYCCSALKSCCLKKQKSRLRVIYLHVRFFFVSRNKYVFSVKLKFCVTVLLFCSVCRTSWKRCGSARWKIDGGWGILIMADTAWDSVWFRHYVKNISGEWDEVRKGSEVYVFFSFCWRESLENVYISIIIINVMAHTSLLSAWMGVGWHYTCYMQQHYPTVTPVRVQLPSYL